MSCFFPPIFKKNAYKKGKLLVFGFMLALVLLLSGCKIARTVVAAPFKVVGWSATKVSEVISGEEAEKSKPKVYRLNPDGSLTEKIVEKAPENASKPVVSKNKNEINFNPLVFWSIILVGIALLVRLLIKRHVAQHTKE